MKPGWQRWNAWVLVAMPLAVCLVLLMLGSGCATRDQQRTTAYVGLVGLGAGVGLFALGSAMNDECKADDRNCDPWRGAGEGLVGVATIMTSVCVLLAAAISEGTIVSPSHRPQAVLPPGQARTAPRPSARPAPEPEPRPADDPVAQAPHAPDASVDPCTDWAKAARQSAQEQLRYIADAPTNCRTVVLDSIGKLGVACFVDGNCRAPLSCSSTARLCVLE